MYFLLLAMSNFYVLKFEHKKGAVPMAQTPLRLSKSRRVVMIVDLAAPEDREAGAVRHQLNWRMPRKGRFWLLQRLSPFRLNLSKLQLHERLLWPFETVRFSCYSPPHSVGPLFCSASSNVER